MLYRKLNILGTEYEVNIESADTDKVLESCDGYCDKTTKRIVVRAEDETSELGNYDVYQRTCLRHEIVHAFLFESGLHQNFEHNQWGHEETMVDWIATQFPKMQKAFEEADCL